MFAEKYFLKLELLSEKIFSAWELHKVGILGTIAVHLVLAILFLSLQIKSRAYLYNSAVEIDFERDFQPDFEKTFDTKEFLLPPDATQTTAEVEAVRNFAVDATSKDLNPALQDDKKTNAADLYREAGRLREQMNFNKSLFEETPEADEINVPNTPEKSTAPSIEGQFQGAAVISYFLEGRKALRLPVPAYKCELGGQVVVDIEVGRDGKVLKAEIDKSNSATDECIYRSALEAAGQSTFTSSTLAPTRQKGSITYLFVPQ